MWKFIFRQNWWNNTPKHNDTWTHSPKTVSWVNNCSSKKCPHLNRDRPNCWAMWHKPSLPLCWGITVTMNGSRVHSGMERNNAQRKLPVLVQLTTETFILLVIFFFFYFWCISRSHVCSFCILMQRCILILPVSSMFPSVFPGLLYTLWTPLPVTSLPESTKSMVWQPVLAHTRSNGTGAQSLFFKLSKALQGSEQGESSLMYERLMD